MKELTEYLPAKLYYELYVNNFKSQLLCFPFLKDASDKFYIVFISLFEIKLYNKNDIIYKPGDIAEEVFIIWKGKFCMINSLNFENYEKYHEKKTIVSLNLHVKNKNHMSNKGMKLRRKFREEQLKVMIHFRSKDIFGENDLKKQEGKIRKFTVRAEDDSVVIVIKKNDFKYLCEINDKFKKYFDDSSIKKESVIKMILNSYQFLMKDFPNKSKLELYEQYLNTTGSPSKSTKEDLFRMILDNKDYRYLQMAIDQMPQEVNKKKEVKIGEKANIHAKTEPNIDTNKTKFNLLNDQGGIEKNNINNDQEIKEVSSEYENGLILQDKANSMYELPITSKYKLNKYIII
jgi:hypothetical protein